MSAGVFLSIGVVSLVASVSGVCSGGVGKYNESCEAFVRVCGGTVMCVKVKMRSRCCLVFVSLRYSFSVD